MAFSDLDFRQRLASAGLIGALLVGAVLETLIFLLIVPLAQTVASGETTLDQEIGPLTIETSASLLVGVIAAMVAVLTATRVASAYLQSRLATAVERRERMTLIDEYISASWELQAQEPPGRLQTIAAFAAARADLLGVVANAARYVLNILVMLAAAFTVAPVGALGISALGGTLFAGFRPVVAVARRLSATYVERSTEHNQDLGELTHIGADMRSFGAGHGFRRRLLESNRAALEAKRRSGFIGGTIVPIYQAIALTIAVAILGLASSREVDVAVLGTVVILLIRSMSYGQALQSSVQKMAESRPAIEALERWHAAYTAQRVHPGDHRLARIERVDLQGVGYRYPDGTSALAGVNLSMGAGEQIGLIGPSGSGKSTLVQVMLGLRPPSGGSVRFNGRDLSDFDDETLRTCVAVVPQRANVFRGSIAENIAFFRPLSQSDIVQAAQRAGLHDTVTSLPDGYETRIGASNRDLSGGQIQRLGIARALAGRPTLIILDEPTSALDVDSEELITDTIRALPDDVIVVIVAHRLSTLRHCTRLAVLEAGSVVSVGTPDELLASSDFYKRAIASGALSDDREVDGV